MSQAQVSVIEKINIVSFEVTTITGSISRESSDDANVFTPGCVRYIDPAHIRPFSSSRQAGQRACRERGVRFLSGWAVPDVSLDKLIAELNVIANKVKAGKVSLLADWDANTQHWLDLNPQIAKYKSRFPDAKYAERQTDVTLSVYRIHPTQVKSSASDGIQTEISGLAGRVLHEVSQDVLDSWKPGAQQASQRIRNLLGRISEKCRTLAFLGGDLGHLAQFIDAGIKRLPASGMIDGADFAALVGILTVLSSPEKMVATARMVEIQGAENSLPEIKPEQAESLVGEMDAALETPAKPADPIEVKPVAEIVLPETPALVPPAAPVRQIATMEQWGF